MKRFKFDNQPEETFTFRELKTDNYLTQTEIIAIDMLEVNQKLKLAYGQEITRVE